MPEENVKLRIVELDKVLVFAILEIINPTALLLF